MICITIYVVVYKYITVVRKIITNNNNSSGKWAPLENLKYWGHCGPTPSHCQNGRRGERREEGEVQALLGEQLHSKTNARCLRPPRRGEAVDHRLDGVGGEVDGGQQAGRGPRRRQSPPPSTTAWSAMRFSRGNETRAATGEGVRRGGWVKGILCGFVWQPK